MSELVDWPILQRYDPGGARLSGRQMSVLETLRDRLTVHRGSAALSEFAKDIGVATKTIGDLLTAKSAASFKKAILDNENGDLTGRKLAGRAETVARMVDYANRGAQTQIRPEDVLTAIGIDVSNANVIAGLSRSQVTGTKTDIDRLTAQTDRVVQDILERHAENKEFAIRAGILVWKPFCESSAPDKVVRSFAGRFTHRLLGALNPGRWKHQLVPRHLAELLVQQDLYDLRLHTVFSMYATPSRELNGLDFIEVPGIRAPLGATSFGLRKAPTWEEILDPETWPTGKTPRMAAVAEDVGADLLQGSCGYGREQMRLISVDVDQPASAGDQALEQSIVKELDQLVREGGSIIFCADASLVESIHAKLSPKNWLLTRTEEGRASAPTFPIALALRGDSPRWKSLLLSALVHDLFDKGAAVTAKHYAEFLAIRSQIEVARFPPTIPADLRREFAKLVLTNLASERQKAYADLERISTVNSKIEALWLDSVIQ